MVFLKYQQVTNQKKLSPDMKVSIESYLGEDYIKFSSNTGFENPSFNAYIPAFSHFTWIQFWMFKEFLEIIDII